LPYYNNERAHMGINYLTPSQMVGSKLLILLGVIL